MFMIQSPAESVSGEGLFSLIEIWQLHVPFSCGRRIEGATVLPSASSITVWILSMKAELLWPHHLPNAPPLNTSTVGMRFQNEFWRDTFRAQKQGKKEITGRDVLTVEHSDDLLTVSSGIGAVEIGIFQNYISHHFSCWQTAAKAVSPRQCLESVLWHAAWSVKVWDFLWL